jgi:hypothetical protein
MRMRDWQAAERSYLPIARMGGRAAHSILHPQSFRQFLDNSRISGLDQTDNIGIRSSDDVSYMVNAARSAY